MLTLRNLFRRRTRSALAVLGISIGIGAFVTLVSISQGFVTTLQRLAGFGSPDVLVQQRDVIDPILSVIPPEMLESLDADPRIAEVDTYSSQVNRQGNQPFFLIFGVKDDGPTWRSCEVLEGNRPQPGEREVLLGKLAAERLGIGVGDSLESSGGKILVTGLFRSTNPLLAGSAVTLRSIHHRMFPTRPLAQIAFLHLRRDEDAEAVIQDINRRFPTLHALEPGLFSEAYPELELSHDLARAVSWIACLAAAVGILNTMMMNVMERTREIGTLLAVGWTRARVLRLILFEGTTLALLGGLAGLLLGYLGARLTVTLLDWTLVEARYNAATFLEALVLALVLGAAGTLVPAIRAARLSPTEALRYE